MTVVEYLSQIHVLEKKIEQLVIRAAEFERLSFSVPSISFDRDRIDCAPNLEAPFIKWLEKKDAVDDEISELKLKAEKLKTEIFSSIDELEDEQHKNILIMRYLNRLSWEQIATKTYMSVSTVKRLHIKAKSLIKVPEITTKMHVDKL